MTVIAYRAGAMAADSGSTNNDSAHSWANKLAKGPDGTLYGIAGNAAEGTAFLEWVRNGYKGVQPIPGREGQDGRDSSFIVLVAPRTGPLRIITAHGEEKYEAPYYAIGAAASVAYGALYMGASAEDAIKAALEHGCGAFGAIRLIKHD